ncbi:MAG: ABC transporter substrate-binding protein [Anaerolineae bacterium]
MRFKLPSLFVLMSVLTLAIVVSACAQAPAAPASAPAAVATVAAVAPTAAAVAQKAAEAPTKAPEATATTAPKLTTAPTTAPTAAPKAAATAAPTGAAAKAAMPVNMDALVAAAKAEGAWSPIALPNDWLNYGQIKQTFGDRYGLKINDIDPQAGSQDEINAIKANKDSKGPGAPDVVEVGYAFGPQMEDGLCEPYKVATWDSIPADVKSKDGCWTPAYYGVFSFAVNTDVVKNVPQDWADLLKPEYKNMIALAGDPLASNQAQQSIFAAALANGGTPDNAMPGLDFFAKLAQQGNLVPVVGTQATLAKGETPILITWDYLASGYKDILKGNPNLQVVIPKSSVFGGAYIESISKYAPHPNAAKLWKEYLLSDEVQLQYLKGFARPIRYDDLKKRGLIPAELAKQLPPDEYYAKAVFPSGPQVTAARKLIADNWDKVVGVKVAK